MKVEDMYILYYFKTGKFITVSSPLISSRTCRYIYKTLKAICHKYVKHKDIYFYWSMTTYFGLHRPSSGHYYKPFKTRQNRVRLHSYYGFPYFILYVFLCSFMYSFLYCNNYYKTYMIPYGEYNCPAFCLISKFL